MKKPNIKINFLHYGTPFNFKGSFIINILKKKYNIILSDKPDYVFFSVYKNNNKFLLEDGTVKGLGEQGESKRGLLKGVYKKLRSNNFMKGIVWFLRDKKILKSYAKIIDIKGDFVKVFYSVENIKPDMSKCDWAFGLHFEQEINHPKYMRVPPYILFRNNLDFGKKKQSINKIRKEKIKFCNFIYNNHVTPRNRFFKELNKYKEVDSSGKCMNNMPPINFHKNSDESRGSKDWDLEKIEFIKPYKFTIASENEIKEGYNTDRIIHAKLGNSIPIYLGDKFIGRDFNVKSFINGDGFNNYKNVIKKVIELDNDDKLYEEMLSQPLFNNKDDVQKAERKIGKRFKEIIENGTFPQPKG